MGGNTINKGQFTFTYNPANRLSAVEQNSAPVADYLYNALGQRVIKTVGNISQVYLYDQNGQLIAEIDPANQTRTEYAYLDGRPLAQWATTVEIPQGNALDFVSDDTPPAQVHVQLDTRTFQLTQPDSTQTTVTVDPADWHDDSGSPFRTITFSGEDSNGVQLSGGLFYWNDVPSLHIDRIQPPIRDGDYDLELTAPDTYSGVDADTGNPATVTLLDLANRTLQIAEQGYPTETYIVAANDWTVQDLGFFQSITYAIQDGDLTLDGGFLINPTLGFGWLQTREGQLQADSYDMVLPAETESYYYHTDHLGTPKALTDENQQIVWRADYTPFGMANITTGQASNNLRFPGQYFDAETGLHYNYFRYYDPSTGRYVTSDPIGLAGGLNTYIYVGGMPTRYVDPFGLEASTPPTPGVATPLPIFIPPVAIPGSKENQAWVEMVNDAMDSDNVIPFPTKPAPDADTKENCPPNNPLCRNTLQMKLHTVSWASPEHDGMPIPGLTKWQCEYTCPNGKTFTKIIVNRLGCPESLPPQ